MPKAKRKQRTRYPEEKRLAILAAAKSGGLTAKQVQEKFGVTPVTYYSWRKKAGSGARRRGRPPGSRGLVSNGALDQQLRAQVQARIRTMLPSIIDSEIAAYFGGGAKQRRRRGK